jgi:tRNA A37 N6-isopentenylltransferase MiaA
MSLADARERLCIATRQYAKRQVTWFGAKKYIETVELRPDLPDPTDTLCARIAEWLEK